MEQIDEDVVESGENSDIDDVDDGETKIYVRTIQLHVKETTPPEPDTGEVNPDATPDGGWGWVVCFACFMTHVLIDGMLYSFGIIFMELLDYFGGTKGETAWIASLAPGIMFLIGPIVGALTNRFGCRIISIIGAFVISGGFIISIFAPNLHFLYFSLGVLTGIGFGLVYLPSIVCVSQYFDKHRALATGLGVCGSGIGTFIFSPLTKYLIDTYTWKGAILIQGGLVLNCIACGAVYRPLADSKQQRNEITPREKSVQKTSDEFINTSTEMNMNVCAISRKMSLPNNITFHQDTAEKKAYPSVSRSRFAVRRESRLPNVADFIKKDEPPAVLNVGKIYRKMSMPINIRSAIHQDTIGREAYPTISLARFAARRESHVPDLAGFAKHDKHPAVLSEIWISLKEAFKLYRNTAFCMFVVSIFFYDLGYYVTYVYLPDKAKASGITDYRAAWLVATVGITSTVGRVVFGYISDWPCINRTYLYGTALVICGVSTCLTPLAVTFVTLLLYSIVFGLFSGVTISLVAVITTDLVGIERLADGFGLVNLFGGVAVLMGPPIAGWMFDATGSYNVSFVVSGVAITISGLLVYFVPCIPSKKHGTDWEINVLNGKE